jgi:hypothetical protein
MRTLTRGSSQPRPNDRTPAVRFAWCRRSASRSGGATADGRRAADAEIVTAAIDRETRRPRALTEDERAALSGETARAGKSTRVSPARQVVFTGSTVEDFGLIRRRLRRLLPCGRFDMNVTVRNYSGSGAHELFDVIVENEDAVRSLITEIGGFRAYYLVRTDDGGFTVSVFEEAAGGEESSRRAAEWIRENAADVNADPPKISSGEAAISF